MAAVAPAAAPVIRRVRGVQPDRILVAAPGVDRRVARRLADDALRQARLHIPKLTGRASRGLRAVYGDGWFGIRWDVDYAWFQEAGRRPQTMRYLAGRVVPMWIDDPTGEERRKNPRARVRTTASGKRQVLIFRKAARIGQRKRVRRVDARGRVTVRDVPASYPGAPGRIARRYPETGHIARTTPPHVGVRWRHPGLLPREFVTYALANVGRAAGIAVSDVHAVRGGGGLR